MKTEAILEERSRSIGQTETVVTYWAACGANATGLQATTREDAEVELEERRGVIEERWAAHAAGMKRYALRFGTAGE